ncbi:FAD-dependent monooxygenase [Microbacterium sp. LRZ72]|uniref:FAD-dependent monooxygenase n=1 Tax=Microbacterium sp. LRZ72 TaxID=2942481 RepID=UPI0029B628D8|nr:FAD-dependent monooxygenase [Microbacterium sp. LRZ72]MDX2377529.1 FAD-dependent monooxygenase [Microbacterium sp. LRZ72]
MERIETEVLIVGAGLSGASAAVMLARHGIQTMMVSRSRWVADSPRAHIVNQRTMEVMRAIDLEEPCYEAATPGDQMANHVMMTAVNGVEFGRMWTWGNDPARAGEYAASPGRGCDLPQDRFEPILVGEAMRRGVVARYRTEFVSLEQDEDGVTTRLRDLITGAQFSVRSRYVIGADGGQSPVAAAIGLPLVGTSGLAPALNVHFEADLSPYFADRPGSIFWVFQPGREGAVGNAMLRMVRPWNEWIVGFVHLGESVTTLTEDQLVQAVREIIQDDAVDVRIIGMYPWRINHVIAESYQTGRVLCAGDAVHRHPPMNGLGGNTCIQDAFNLAWKLAAVLRWDAGTALLDTYTAERQPVGQNVVDRAIAGWHQNPAVVRALGVDPAAAPAERQAQFDVLFADSDEGERRREDFEAAKRSKIYSYHAHGTEMNQVYDSAAVIGDGSAAPEPERDVRLFYQPTSRPGARVPHCWVGRAGRTVSTLDLCGPEQFTLLTRARGRAWVDAAQAVAARTGVPIAAHRIGHGGDIADLYAQWADVSEIGERGCVLVRPDQHVAWRSEGGSDDPRAELTRVLRACLAQPGA